MKLRIKVVLLAVIVLAALIQTIQPDRSNPEPQGSLIAAPEVMAVLKRSCYDCHSNESHWPWYSYVAPASWVIAKHIQKGRKHLNFSDWGAMDGKKQQQAFSDILEVLQSGEMPLKSYLLLHGDAELKEDDVMLLRQWTLQGGNGERQQADIAE